MKDTTKITMVQLSDANGSDDTFAKMEQYFVQAKEYGSDLIVFPEYVLGHKIPVSHPRVQAFFKLAGKYNIYAIAGLVELHEPNWATTALVVDRSGNLIGRYLKCHPASGQPPYFWPPVEGADSEARGLLGNQFKVFHLDFGTIGILQCYDGYFPEAWGCTSYLGAEIVIWINGRAGMVEDSICINASCSYGCVVGANITQGRNTGFSDPWGCCITAEGEREESRLFPRIKDTGDNCVSAEINLKALRRYRKHMRTMHQRRPELYGLLTKDVKIWQDYPDTEWIDPGCIKLTNKSQL